MSILQERAHLEAIKYMAQQDYEIVQTKYECEAGKVGIVAIDLSTLEYVFIFEKVTPYYKKGFPEDLKGVSRTSAEQIMTNYFADYPDVVDKDIRFDALSFIQTSPNSAFMRHHKNALPIPDGVPEFENQTDDELLEEANKIIQYLTDNRFCKLNVNSLELVSS